jgi:VWFA-related protein
LSKDESVVLEDGKPQTIRVFAEQLTTSARVQRTPIANGSFSNVLETGSTPKRLAIIAPDLVNTPILLQGSARNELLQYLAKSFDPGEPTELVAIGRSGLVVLHDFSSDPALLVGALQRFSGTSLSLAEKQSASQGPPPRDALAAIVRMLAHLENEDKASMEAFDRRTAILTTLDAMQQIAAALAGIPGRKALLWLSAGFPSSISQTDAAPGLGTVLDPYQRTWRLLNQSQVAVYPIDIRAPTNPKFRGVDEPGTKQLPWEPPGDDPYTDILMRDDKEQQEILTTLQNRRRAFFDSNDLQHGFREAVRDNASHHMLGHYLDRHGKKPGWHRLQVRVHRDGVSGNREVAKSPPRPSAAGSSRVHRNSDSRQLDGGDFQWRHQQSRV